MTLLMRDQENWERGRAEGRAEGKAEGKAEGRAEGMFKSLDSLLQNNPAVGVETGAAMLGFDTKELAEYKRARGLEPVGV